MKILLLCLKGFETMEFSPFIDVIGWARNDYGMNICVETCGFSANVISTFGTVLVVDKLIDDINVDEYDALAIPGGFEEYGFYEEAYHDKTLALINQFNDKGKIIASICVGALPIAKSGALKGRMATTYHMRGGYRRKQMEEMGVILGEEWFVVDNNIITSSCPRTAPDVAFKLLELLTSLEDMMIVKRAMGYA